MSVIVTGCGRHGFFCVVCYGLDMDPSAVSGSCGPGMHRHSETTGVSLVPRNFLSVFRGHDRMHQGSLIVFFLIVIESPEPTESEIYEVINESA